MGITNEASCVPPASPRLSLQNTAELLNPDYLSLIQRLGWGSAVLIKALTGVSVDLNAPSGQVDDARFSAKGQSSKTASNCVALLKRVFEVDPLEYSQCGSRMKSISFIERRQRDVVEMIFQYCGLRKGPLRTLATARSPPGSADSGRESAEPRKLQLVLDPEYLQRVPDTVSNTLDASCANRAPRCGRGKLLDCPKASLIRVSHGWENVSEAFPSYPTDRIVVQACPIVP